MYLPSAGHGPSLQRAPPAGECRTVTGGKVQNGPTAAVGKVLGMAAAAAAADDAAAADADDDDDTDGEAAADDDDDGASLVWSHRDLDKNHDSSVVVGEATLR